MFELDIAMKHIRSRQRQTLFSIIAVALAVAIIIVSMSMMSGYMSILIDSTVENQAHITIMPGKDEDYIHLYRGLEDHIHNLEGVLAVSSYFQGEAALQYRHDVEGVVLYGINPYDENRVYLGLPINYYFQETRSGATLSVENYDRRASPILFGVYKLSEAKYVPRVVVFDTLFLPKFNGKIKIKSKSTAISVRNDVIKLAINDLIEKGWEEVRW